MTSLKKTQHPYFESGGFGRSVWEMATLRRPWVVVDLCLIRGIKFNQGIPGNYSIVVPDRLFVECATTEDPKGVIAKLASVLESSNAEDRVLVSKAWQWISELERRGIAPTFEQIDWEVSGRFREWIRARKTLQYIEKCLEQYNPDSEDELGFRASFCRDPDWLRQRLGARYPREYKRIVQSPDNIIPLLREPDLVAEWVLFSNPDIRGRRIRRLLSQFPDVLASGKWARLMAYYLMYGASGRTKDHENRFDDAHYAFASSYTFDLATNDGELKAAVRACFPGVRIHDNLDSPVLREPLYAQR